MSSALRTLPYQYDRETTTLPGSGGTSFSEVPRSSKLVGKAVVERLDPKEKTAPSVYHQSDLPFRAAPILRPVAANKEASFTVDKEWEGVIDDVGISHFTAQLREVGTDSDQLDLAEIPIGDVLRDQRDSVRSGAVFRFLAGYAQDTNGTAIRKRLIYFRKGKSRIDSARETRWMEMAALFTNE
jgi:hypothetical protein